MDNKSVFANWRVDPKSVETEKENETRRLQNALSESVSQMEQQNEFVSKLEDRLDNLNSQLHDRELNVRHLQKKLAYGLNSAGQAPDDSMTLEDLIDISNNALLYDKQEVSENDGHLEWTPIVHITRNSNTFKEAFSRRMRIDSSYAFEGNKHEKSKSKDAHSMETDTITDTMGSDIYENEENTKQISPEDPTKNRTQITGPGTNKLIERNMKSKSFICIN